MRASHALISPVGPPDLGNVAPGWGRPAAAGWPYTYLPACKEKGAAHGGPSSSGLQRIADPKS